MTIRITALAASLLLGTTVSTMAANITSTEWGTTSKGEKAQLFTLTGAKGLEAHITNFGGVIVDLLVPNKSGGKTDVMLGYDNLAAYEKGGVYGALIGRYANRIGSGGTFPLEGNTVQIERPNPTQQIVIHGGTWGFQKQVWQATMQDGPEPRLTLKLVSPDGSGGFPGTLDTTVIYTVTRDNALKLEYRATTDKPTVVNLTNHAYFALQGEGMGDVQNQVLQVFADHFTPSTPDNLPTGKIAPVDGTALDFRKPVRLGDMLGSSFDQVAMRKGLDINMVVNGRPGTLRKAVHIVEPSTGIAMDVSTTQPGVQLYSDNLTRPSIGKGGRPNPNWSSMSFETQHYPDSPNRPEFPTTELKPGQVFHETTVFKFSVVK